MLLEKDENKSIGHTTASWSENKSADLINSLMKCTQFFFFCSEKYELFKVHGSNGVRSAVLFVLFQNNDVLAHQHRKRDSILWI